MTASTADQAAVVVPMPRLSDSMEEGTVVRWLVADGEAVERGQEVVEIETDKATMTFEAPAAGPLWILAEADRTVAIGEPIARIGGAREGVDADSDPAPAPVADSTPAADAAPTPATTAEAADPTAGAGNDSAAVRVSPVARRLAAERGIDLATVVGSGPRGRILKEDVLSAGDAPEASPAVPQASPAVPATAAAVTGARGSSRRETLTRTQEIVARRMSEARATVPEFPVVDEVEMTAAVELRRQLKAALDPAPSLNDLLSAAVARTLPAHPRLNAAYLDGAFEFFEQVNLGIAVAVEDELLVPVIAGADQLSLGAIAAASRRLIERTRSGEVTPPELAGGTFTISNLGMFGISSFQPIVNPPQAAILGVGGLRPARGDLPATISLTLVSDHRIVYGAHAARFLAALRDLLENPLALLAS